METTTAEVEKAMATSKDVVDAVVQGDLNAANDAFDQVLAAKREAGWEVAKADFARTVFDEPAEEPEEELPVEAEAETEAPAVEEPETEEE